VVVGGGGGGGVPKMSAAAARPARRGSLFHALGAATDGRTAGT